MIAQPARLAGLDRVDGQRPAVDAPARRRAQVLVVVAQVPHHVVDTAGLRRAATPVMGNAGDPAQRVSGFRTGGVHLTHDGVLGALDRGKGCHGRANTRVAILGPGRRQLARR
ncbi:hypothetical protein AWB94_30760 [Mycolicibacterium canariasense]|nr:hypothetical protein AWB94_30760 [Mycolicibacterium canariasense]